MAYMKMRIQNWKGGVTVVKVMDILNLNEKNMGKTRKL
jgi:hypothetical protein